MGGKTCKPVVEPSKLPDLGMHSFLVPFFCGCS